jgi:hypothetical protein
MRDALTGVACGMALGAVAKAGAQQKMTQQEAHYQNRPNDWQSCAACTLFVRPASCKIVSGEISADGWCKAFDMGD